jgi:hypothetical protein
MAREAPREYGNRRDGSPRRDHKGEVRKQPTWSADGRKVLTTDGWKKPTNRNH